MVLSDFEKNILENNLFGVDLNEESVEIAKLSLWLRTAQPNRKLNDLNNNIKCGNSLIDDPAVAGDKAFNWQTEFPSVFAKGGFDVVIGNPPYVVYLKSIIGEKVLGNIIKKYDFAEYNPNTYALFTDLGLNFLLKQGGYLSYIFPNTWLEGQYFSRMRKGVYSKFVEEIVYLKDTVFQEVVETVILICKNVNGVIENIRISSNVIAGEYQTIQFESEKFLGGYNPFITQDNPLLEKLETKFSRLGHGAIVYRGLETRDNEKWLSETKESDLYIPILLGRDVNRYNYTYSGTYVKFIKKEMKSNANVIMYQQPKILIRRTGATIIASLERENLLALKNLYLIIPKGDNNIYSMMAQINSRLMSYYHKMKSSEENKAFAQFKGVYIEGFPYVKSNNDEFQVYIEKIIEQTNSLYRIQIHFTELIQTKYDIEKLTTKLQNWYELDAKEFLNELKKSKVQISLSAEAEWMHYFNEQKQVAQALKSEIDKTDKEIDRMVYELYGLTEEEIGIVEGAS